YRRIKELRNSQCPLGHLANIARVTASVLERTGPCCPNRGEVGHRVLSSSYSEASCASVASVVSNSRVYPTFLGGVWTCRRPRVRGAANPGAVREVSSCGNNRPR